MLEILAQPHEILQPNNADIWERGGFLRVHDFIIAKAYAIKNYELFNTGKTETYQAHTFYSKFYAQFVKTVKLPQFLADLGEGVKFFDQLSLREGDKRAWGMSRHSGAMQLYDDAYEMLEWLNLGGSGQTRETGALTTYEYIQVIFIIWGRT